MDDCCAVGSGADRYEPVFDGRFAERMARRYARHGLTPPERRMVDFLTGTVGVTGASVLEVGGGVGELHVELLKRGAVSATNLELSGAYEGVADRIARDAGVADRITRRIGIDLAQRPADVARADLVLLHRVVCCYPDADGLLAAAASRTSRALVFTHPPHGLPTRLATSMVNLAMRLRRRTYRGYVHSPTAMTEVLRRHGLEPRLRERAGAWWIIGAVRV